MCESVPSDYYSKFRIDKHHEDILYCRQPTCKNRKTNIYFPHKSVVKLQLKLQFNFLRKQVNSFIILIDRKQKNISMSTKLTAQFYWEGGVD